MTAPRMAPAATRIGAGCSAPLGATPSEEVVNFSIFSRHATAMELLLFDAVDDARPAQAIRIDPIANRTYHYWHVFVPDVRPGQIYGYRVEGPSDPARGLRFDYDKVLLDPYVRDLGGTAVELLPVFQFDAQAAPNEVNYWGYQPVSFFAPHQAYSSRRDPLGPVDEFRDMVKALHRAGLEVILDVVFNHTAEGGHDGPTLCFRGLDNAMYYILERDRARYADYTGCGNTLNANDPIVRRLIVDSLRYWVEVMHVDGFRFDLASILTRDASGEPMPNPPVLWDIESDPVLAGTKLFAEAWDAAGLYP